MKALALSLCLIFLPQTDSHRSLPIIQNDQVQRVDIARAKAEYERLKSLPTLSEKEFARLVALEIAIGSDPTVCTKDQERAMLCRRREEEK